METLRFSEVFLATSDYFLSKRNRRYTVATIGFFYCSGLRTFCNFVVKYPKTYYNTKSVEKTCSFQKKYLYTHIFAIGLTILNDMVLKWYKSNFNKLFQNNQIIVRNVITSETKRSLN